jgi:hypothetical protein
MAIGFSESDWKTFRRLQAVALERFCERILQELKYIACEEQGTYHARYLAAYKLIEKRDDQIARAFNSPRRSVALAQLIALADLDLLTEDEMRSFSPSTQSVAKELRRPRGRAHAPKSA